MSASGACQTVIANARATKQVLYLPVFDGVIGSGGTALYHLKGFAAFVVTGYRMPSFTAGSWLTGGHHCHPSETCIYGFFTEGLVPVGAVLGGPTTPSMGASAVQMIG